MAKVVPKVLERKVLSVYFQADSRCRETLLELRACASWSGDPMKGIPESGKKPQADFILGMKSHSHYKTCNLRGQTDENGLVPSIHFVLIGELHKNIPKLFAWFGSTWINPMSKRASQWNLHLQLAPSLEHQTAAMLSILERYKWHQFSVVTSQIAGHDDFIQAVRERALQMQSRFKS
ncbi:Uncharacterized protein GBIM_11924 [Gryllus bimaculatus]|nr:Uncharacterized protein GBIM_11924 [Gryllus bimaculatus]